MSVCFRNFTCKELNKVGIGDFRYDIRNFKIEVVPLSLLWKGRNNGNTHIVGNANGG